MPQHKNSNIDENKPVYQKSNGINSSNSIKSNYSSYPPSPSVSCNNFQRNATYTSDITNNNNRNNDNEPINRSITAPANITNNINTCSSPVSNYNDNIDIAPVRDTGDEPVSHVNSSFNNSEFQNPEYYTSPSIMTNNNNQDEDEGEFTDDSDDINGKYLCTKKFNAKEEEFQIDLHLNDLVTINQFTGKYILGKNCRTNCEGLFPIYYIDSLDGNYVFFRCKEEMEFASVNDEIFLLRESASEHYPGYNITKGEQGIFSISKLEPIIMDDETRNKYETLYYKEKDEDSSSSIKNRTPSYSTINSSINIDSSDSINNLADPVLPTNSGSGSSINTRNNRNNRNIGSNNSLNMPMEFLGGEEIKNDDGTIVAKLLNYYNTISEDDPFNKSKGNNLDRMRDAIKKFQEFKGEDKKGDMLMLEMEGKGKEKMDSFISPKIIKDFENKETKNRKWEANRYRCQELIDTEKSYCSKIKIMIDKFMKRLDDVQGTENEMLNNIQINIIFKYIPDIYKFSSKLCEELDEAFTHYEEEGPIPIARVFLNKFSEWKLYIRYVENYQQANQTLENLKESPQTNRFNRFMEQCQRSEECGRSNLKELIVLPIQRFLKYKLLFEGIKKDSDPRNREDYNLLDTVENYVFEIGEIMNNAKRLQENIDKLFSLERIILNFPPELISSRRNYIAEWTISGITNKKEKLYLLSDIVIFAAFLNKKKKNKYMFEFENRIHILDYDVKSTTINNNKAIKFVETERFKNSKHNNRLIRNNHSHSLLSFGRSTHTHSITMTSITKALFYFESEEICDEFIKKYEEQKNTLLNNSTNTSKNNKYQNKN